MASAKNKLGVLRIYFSCLFYSALEKSWHLMSRWFPSYNASSYLLVAGRPDPEVCSSHLNAACGVAERTCQHR